MSQDSISLKDALCFIVDNRGKTVPTEETGMKLIATNCISNTNLYPSYINLRYISDEIYRNWFRAHPEPGDIILTNKGSKNGAICLVPDEVDFCIAQDMMALRADPEKIDPLYLFAALRSEQVQADIKNLNVDGVIPHFKKTDFKNLLIPLPERSEQVQIGLLHYELCKKIELNRKTAATLEEMARALYRSWFVDFDPVHAKAAGQAPAHMDTQTAALFPESFGEDGVPEGWEEEPLARHVAVLRGLSYKGAGLCDEGEGVPLHNLNSVFEGGGYKTSGVKYYRGDFKPRHEIIPGDLIVTNTEQGFNLLLMGHSALVPHHFGPTGLFSQHIYKVEPKPESPLSREWLYLMLSVSPKGQEIRAYSNGTTVNMLPMDALEIPEVCTPPHDAVAAFDDVVRPMFARQESIEVENQTLATLRDTLLPRLMSGELRVGDAKEQVEAVA